MRIARMSDELSLRAQNLPAAAPPPAAAEPKPSEQPPRDLLVTEVDGNWRFVTEKARAAGPSEGEIWLIVAEMRKVMSERDPGPMTAKPAGGSSGE